MASTSKKKRRKRRPRPDAVAKAPPEPARPRPARARRAAADERPPAPWGTFPLVELVVLVGIVMLVAGLIVGFDAPRGQALLGTGLALASLAGLELSVREHFSGFRSHTALLASASAVASMLALYYLVKTSSAVAIAAAAGVGLLAAVLLVRVFRSRSGGRSVKLR